jgi:hypothetical protein
VKHAALARTFHRILAASMPTTCAAMAAGCAGQSIPSSSGDVSGAASGTSSGSSGNTLGVSSGSSGIDAGISSGSTTGVSTGSSGDFTGVSSGSIAGATGGSSAGEAGGVAASCLQNCMSKYGSGSGSDGFIVAELGECECLCQNSSLAQLGDGGLALDDAGNVSCQTYCGANFGCSLVDVGVVQCVAFGTCIGGRRPAGLLESDPARGTLLGAHFAEMARLEAASVAAFRHMRGELVAHGAPKRLVRAAERAARDEIQHARMTRALARSYGAVGAEPAVEPCAVRSLQDIAVENAVEGCVREAFGALVACWQARVAADPVIRAAMKRIARDETRHAALAFEVDAWVRGRLDASGRARVEEGRRQAFDDLFARSGEAPIALRAPLGLPTQLQSRVLLSHMARLAA